MSPQPDLSPPTGTGAAIVSVAHANPERVVDNAEIATRLGVEPEWLTRRTGTRQRYVSGPGEGLVDLAEAAARRALERAGLDGSDLDAVFVGTTSTEDMSPHAAPMVAYRIGATRASGIDISAACTGFLAGLSSATALIESGRAGTVLVIGADALFRYTDPDDRGSAMLFGDGAGAAVVTAVDGPTRIGPVVMHADAGGYDLIRLPRDERLIRMDGPTVYKYAVTAMAEVTGEALAAAGATQDDVDLFVYHQANSRIIAAVGQRLGLPPDKVVDVVGEFANTSAASLPIALSWAYEHDRLHDGDRVLLGAFGAGMVWGGTLLTWGR